MVRHIVAWKLKDTLSFDEREDAMRTIKERLEALQDVIEGILEMKVIRLLSSSTADLALISTFTNEEALKNYQVHPAHQAAAAYVATVRESRVCVDYVE